MEKTKLDEISGWFAGRLPDGWFTGAPSVTTDDKQVLVVGTLDAPALSDGSSAETATCGGTTLNFTPGGSGRRQREGSGGSEPQQTVI
jgi:hypothetical protein